MSVFALASCQDSPAPPLSSFRYQKSYFIPSAVTSHLIYAYLA